MEYVKEGKTYVVKVARGERLVKSVKKLVNDEKIEGGFFVGLGACDEVELAHYSVEDKKYTSKKFRQALEIANLTGNVAWAEGELVVHAHGTFGDEEMRTVAGHVVDLKISATLELWFTETERLVKRKDEETGLNLLALKRV